MPEPSRKEMTQRAQALKKAARARSVGATIHVLPRRPHPPAPALPPYAELHCLTHFSFQRGASSPEDLVRRAWGLGYTALAITDECSVAGVVRAWKARKDAQTALETGEADAELLQLQATRAALGAQEPLKLLVGSEFRFEGQGTLVTLARDLQGWGDLCSFISACRRAAPKGQYTLPSLADALRALQACELLWSPVRQSQVAIELISNPCLFTTTQAGFDSKITLLAELHGDADDALWLAQLRQLSQATGWPLAAAGDVHLHVRAAKRLHDVMTAIRIGKPVADCGFALQANAERHLRPRARLAEVFSPELLAATLEVAGRCTFELDEIKYHYPKETVPAGQTPSEALTRLTREGASWRFPAGAPAHVQAFIDKELVLIAECQYEMFFLTVHDIVRWARGQGILCQGRGSAANSVVCYCLGITEADPRVSNPLLERFISRQRRNEPPDIDVDFEHERREEVIQYIYRKYGRDRAALAATVICYRRRSALRDVGKALGVDERLIDAFAKDHHWFDDGLAAHRLGDLAHTVGATIAPRLAQLWLELTEQLRGAPRHLSQHVGGFVLTEPPLVRLVPVENAAMADRQVIQWDKDDLEALGMMKVDVLALGMLTALRRCLAMVGQRHGRTFTRADIPRDCEKTYQMIQRADTVGTFQIESRAQMSMLPRLRPAVFYDLVVQVAIVRPGPISGGMVHPYLKARERWARDKTYECERSSKEPPDVKPALTKALERTLGIPIFQEQVMEIAIIAAGFSAERADQLRRSMAAWKRHGGVHKFEAELKDGMRERGYSAEFAQRIFSQILGFGEYGFPESHAYSFALIAYESSWLKCHEPEAFLAAMLNSQPMGFYGPAQLVQDAQRHGVAVLPPDVAVSGWDCALEELGSDHDPIESAQIAPDSLSLAPSPASREREGVSGLFSPSPAGGGLGWGSRSPSTRPPLAPHPNPLPKGAREQSRPAVRLGLRLIQGLNEAAGRSIETARADQPFANVDDLARRAHLDMRELNALAVADALASLAGHRRQQVWQGAALKAAPKLLRDAPIDEAPLNLPAAPEGEEIVHDYAALGLTLRRHPLALLRERLARRGVQSATELNALPHGRRVTVCGLVIGRQQPVTAKGTIFVTLEDETGPVNVIVWKSTRTDEQQRNALLRARLLAVQGEWQRDKDSGGQVRHLIAQRFFDLTPLLGRIASLTTSRDFH
ncbi:error-prone DNA polymerase [Ottowia sp.]|uniref:error-prone DNA polymerase n=1 Tax=Ottowia sp. TaxID=1898956 RepID=UPI002C7E4A63|nr:error-prone DNA polymerase [Ottowia sp.]HOB67454.1 error-prone DNA polymerase [Ottowia sp.]HPZ56312.1 error-prone DNA polymerase [Ottowia sp.]HQD47555.1 error-prone DNA polymerase [Ottowia sp.]